MTTNPDIRALLRLAASVLEEQTVGVRRGFFSGEVQICRMCGGSGGHDTICLVAQLRAAELATANDEQARFRAVLADAIRSPMGVIPDSAEGLVTHSELDLAEARRLRSTNKATP